MLLVVTENELCFDSVRPNLETRFIGRNIIYYSSLPSTMDAARRAIDQGVPEGTVIVASEQTAGRGRLKRRWLSPSGCLAVSIVLSPGKQLTPVLVMASALAVLDTVEKFIMRPAEIKWPNDVLASGKKISGILIETAFKEGEPPHTIIGIGMNINIDMFDTGIAASATSLSAEAGTHFSISRVLAELLNRMECRHESLLYGDPIFETWKQKLSTLGKSVTVQAGETVVQGTVVDVSSDGAIVLKLPSGGSQRVFAGDVIVPDMDYPGANFSRPGF